MNKLKGSISFFKVLSGAVAVIPGLLVLEKNLPLPPRFSTHLASALVEIFCCFVVAFAWINKESFRKISVKKFNRVSMVAFLLFLLFLSIYGVLLNLTTIDSLNWLKQEFIPLFAMKPVPEGSFQHYYDEFGPDAIIELVKTDFKIEGIVTEAAVYGAFCLTFTFLTVTFTSLWLKQEAMGHKSR